MGRRDYLNDPDAPRASSLVPAASVVVVDSEGRVLLQRRTDNGMWALLVAGWRSAKASPTVLDARLQKKPAWPSSC